MNEPKILVFDIETTHLKPDFGTVLAIGYKWYGTGKTTVLSVMDYPGFKKDATDDRGLIAAFAEQLEQADIIVTYFGKGFDKPYLQSKMLEYGLGVFPNMAHVDLFFAVKSNMALSRKSLGNVGLYLKLKAGKTPLDGRIWKRAMTGHEPSIKYIVKHCYSDVDLTSELYTRLRPLIRQHPRVKGINNCRACGGSKIQRRGYNVSVLRGPQYRIKCMNPVCGHWETRALPRDQWTTAQVALFTERVAE